MEEKAVLRRSFLSMRESLSEETREQFSWRIEKHLWQYLERFQSLMGYWPIRGEVDVTSLMRRWLLKEKRLFLPRVRGPDIEVVEVDNLDYSVRPGYCGIPEPLGEKTDGRAEVVLVPGIVFDERGYRVGYGAGFYDRFLNENSLQETIGVAYRFQILRKIPHGESDIPLRRIVCEEGWIV